MTQFNISRFAKTLKWAALTTRKEALTNMAMMFFAFTVPFIFFMLDSYNRKAWESGNSLLSATKVNVAIFFIICMVGGCWIFNNMKTKEQRISFKILPATDIEKFLARALYVTIGWWVTAILAYCLADIFRMLLCLVTGVSVVKCTIPDFLGHIFATSINVNTSGEESFRLFIGAVITFITSCILWAHSFYILGGTFFRRRRFVFTTLAHFALGVAVTPALNHTIDFIDDIATPESATAIVYSAAAVFFVLTLVNWWLSYKIFKRMQVINNKWINL